MITVEWVDRDKEILPSKDLPSFVHICPNKGDRVYSRSSGKKFVVVEVLHDLEYVNFDGNSALEHRLQIEVAEL